MLFRLFEGVNDSNFNYSNVKNRNIISENFNREIWDLINKNKGLREALE
ncbi:MAG: hypothetical protein LBC61_01090 [Candidatus Peribacteria bacterium]|jgi:hypothetical protein|nr:hypothetical protein [Candidatus Peribacteria bacterium]